MSSPTLAGPAARSAEPPSCADRFVALIAACRELGLTGTDDAAVRRPHRTVDDFRFPAFADDARRLTDLARGLTEVSGAAGADAVAWNAGESTATTPWSGRAGHAAGGILRVVGADVAVLAARLESGAAVTARAAGILQTVLDRHRGVVDTVSRPQIGGFDLESLPAALNSGALSQHALRGEVQARLDYAATAGLLAGEAIAVAIAEVSRAWSSTSESDGELVLADLR